MQIHVPYNFLWKVYNQHTFDIIEGNEKGQVWFLWGDVSRCNKTVTSLENEALQRSVTLKEDIYAKYGDVLRILIHLIEVIWKIILL